MCVYIYIIVYNANINQCIFFLFLWKTLINAVQYGREGSITPNELSSRKLEIARKTFHAMMTKIKDRNGMDLTEAEYIKKMWQEYTDKLYKKDLHDPDNHDGMITHLETDILECKV